MNEDNICSTDLIKAERQRQISEEGWTPEHDDQHNADELCIAASIYALPDKERKYYSDSGVPLGWPWADKWWKPSPDDRVRELVKAGALIVAEIDRLRRIEDLSK